MERKEKGKASIKMIHSSAGVSAIGSRIDALELWSEGRRSLVPRGERDTSLGEIGCTRVNHMCAGVITCTQVKCVCLRLCMFSYSFFCVSVLLLSLHISGLEPVRCLISVSCFVFLNTISSVLFLCVIYL